MYTATTTGTDTYTLTETGTTGGGFTETVSGNESYTVTETGNSGAGEYQRTTTGGGSYILTASGAGLSNGSGTTGYTLTETGNPLSGDFSQTETGTTRYDLLEGFNNVADTSGSSTPGHLNFVPYGVAFVDPQQGGNQEPEKGQTQLPPLKPKDIPEWYNDKIMKVGEKAIDREYRKFMISYTRIHVADDVAANAAAYGDKVPQQGQYIMHGNGLTNTSMVDKKAIEAFRGRHREKKADKNGYKDVKFDYRVGVTYTVLVDGDGRATGMVKIEFKIGCVGTGTDKEGKPYSKLIFFAQANSFTAEVPDLKGKVAVPPVNPLTNMERVQYDFTKKNPALPNP